MKQYLFNPIIISCVLSIIITQVIKIFTSKEHVLKAMFDSGGMPSSHSSLVTALTVSVFFVEGFTTLFIVVFFFSALVIRDAMGVRWITGEQSKTINKIIKTQKIGIEEVKVIMGHTGSQVVVGISIGLVISVCVGFLL